MLVVVSPWLSGRGAVAVVVVVVVFAVVPVREVFSGLVSCVNGTFEGLARDRGRCEYPNGGDEGAAV